MSTEESELFKIILAVTSQDAEVRFSRRFANHLQIKIRKWNAIEQGWDWKSYLLDLDIVETRHLHFIEKNIVVWAESLITEIRSGAV